MSFFNVISNDLKAFDWRELGDFENIGDWPAVVKNLFIAAVFLGCVVAGYFFDTIKLQDQQKLVMAQEANLRIEFEQKAFQATNLEQYRLQVERMEESFSQLLLQLPTEVEVPGLIDDITRTGLGSGLEFSNLTKLEDIMQEFYIETPLEIRVEGGFHDFGTFVSGVASLDRIVTLHDFTIRSRDGLRLEMNILAKTYYYKSEQAVMEDLPL
ncbi:MAG: pilus assembly protein PilP [SAR86 cluster bacterium]|uniref:Pilus assembly protein PilP n=1 Tax=SAR86 cluster bacterium TaxID=2030880 RepID=A0A2A4MMJ0_9GAMM|nr:MAG: pilus assembly protein PilP [SAR86 cluster bacterium]